MTGIIDVYISRALTEHLSESQELAAVPLSAPALCHTSGSCNREKGPHEPAYLFIWLCVRRALHTLG